MESRKRRARQPEAPNTSDLFLLDYNLRPLENSPVLTATKRIETSAIAARNWLVETT